MLSIQSGIPIPANIQNRKGKEKIYPFNDMKVGDSFLVPYDSRNNCPKIIIRRIASAATGYRTLYCTKTSYVSAECSSKLGVRCWRTA